MLARLSSAVEQVADDGAGPAGQILQRGGGLGAHRLGLQRQDAIPTSLSRPRMRLIVPVRASVSSPAK
jgi:hypothetical protein